MSWLSITVSLATRKWARIRFRPWPISLIKLNTSSNGARAHTRRMLTSWQRFTTTLRSTMATWSTVPLSKKLLRKRLKAGISTQCSKRSDWTMNWDQNLKRTLWIALISSSMNKIRSIKMTSRSFMRRSPDSRKLLTSPPRRSKSGISTRCSKTSMPSKRQGKMNLITNWSMTLTRFSICTRTVTSRTSRIWWRSSTERALMLRKRKSKKIGRPTNCSLRSKRLRRRDKSLNKNSMISFIMKTKSRIWKTSRRWWTSSTRTRMT